MYKWMQLCKMCYYRTLHSLGKVVQKELESNAQTAAYVSFWRLGTTFQKYCTNNRHGLLQDSLVQQYLQSLIVEFGDITETLQNGVSTESERRALMKRQIELLPVQTAFENTENAAKDLKQLEALFQSITAEDDNCMMELLRKEHDEMSKQLKTLKEQLIKTLVPGDRYDTNDIILEVVSGRTTGGDICQQFTKEVFDMYENFASHKNWDFEVFNYTSADYGGLHHAAARISGENVYRFLKHEGGTHRVQRIPHVGLSSRMQRIHTGTTTVIVLPQPSKIELDIDPKELHVDTFRSSGAGGQSVNTTDSAVRVIHIPTGIKVECQQSRSQLQNRETAMRVLRARIYQQMIDKENEEVHAKRKSQVGTRSQSDRIRTYNFTQDRVTDHRTGGVTRDIKELLHGGLLLNKVITEVVEHFEKAALLDLATRHTQRNNGC